MAQDNETYSYGDSISKAREALYFFQKKDIALRVLQHFDQQGVRDAKYAYVCHYLGNEYMRVGEFEEGRKYLVESIDIYSNYPQYPRYKIIAETDLCNYYSNRGENA